MLFLVHLIETQTDTETESPLSPLSDLSALMILDWFGTSNSISNQVEEKLRRMNGSYSTERYRFVKNKIKIYIKLHAIKKNSTHSWIA